jgi:hypothetical protein
MAHRGLDSANLAWLHDRLAWRLRQLGGARWIAVSALERRQNAISLRVLDTLTERRRFFAWRR